MPERIKVLIVEDSNDDAKLMARELERGGYQVVFRRVQSEVELRAALAGLPWDLILSDFTMPGFNGLKALAIVKDCQVDLPFIYVSGTIGEDTAVESMRAGAHDYVLKNNLVRLVPAVRRELQEVKERRRRRAAEAALSQQELRFRALIENAMEVISVVSSKGLFSYNSPSLERVLGRKPEEVLGQPIYELVCSQDHARLQALLHAEPGLCPPLEEIDFRHRDGTRRSLEVAAGNLGSNPVLGGVVLNMRDITRRRRAERERSLILESVGEGIYGLDLNGRCTFINPSALKMLGYELAEILGRDLHELIHSRRPEGQAYPAESCPARRALIEGSKCRLDSECLWRKDGQPLPVEYSCSPILEGGQVHGAVIAFSDISQKRALQAQFLRAQRLENIGTLASGIAHDLNNIFAPILMAVPILLQEVTAEPGLTVLNILESSAARGADVLKQLLTFGKGAELKQGPLQLRHLIREVEKLAQETFPKSINVRTLLAKDLWAVTGSATQLHQVLLNLAVNARDAMPAGGTLTFKAQNILVEEMRAKGMPGAQPGPHVAIEIADTGTGIPTEVADKIFDPFFSTKGPDKGTGLGLSTVLGIVKAHHGIIEFSTEPGKGTTFAVFLPASTGTVIPISKAKPSSLPKGRGELVLIVDDELAICSVTRRTLESNGYRTLVASSGAEALDLYKEKSADISLVVTDLNMPGLSGDDTIQALRKVNPAAKIVVATGAETGRESPGAGPAGACALLKKPFNAVVLLETVAHELKATAPA